MLYDFGCYGADLMTWLMRGENPLSVTAVAQTNKPNEYLPAGISTNRQDGDAESVAALMTIGWQPEIEVPEVYDDSQPGQSKLIKNRP